MNGWDGLRVRRDGKIGWITLDRPQALNALTLTMVRGLTATLRAWEHDDAVRVIVLDGAGDRAFCAGGDIKSIHDADRSHGNPTARTFWREEYALDLAIATYSKPIVVLMGGIVMGGGAGLAINARFRVVDATTRFAMPETGIGLVPDVGASRFLSRMPDETGTYLSLTGETIDSYDMVATGLADAFIPTSLHPELLDLLNDVDAGPAAFATVGEILARLATTPGPSRLLARTEIHRLFAGDSVETILERLTADASDFTLKIAGIMRLKSPTSQKIALQALRRGRRLPGLREVLQMEFRVVCRIAAGTDFYEGVRAAVIDKDRRPRWTPADLESVSMRDVDAYFADLGADELIL